MIFSSILVAYDQSELALKSLEKAIELAKLDTSVEIHVVHVIKLPINNSIIANTMQQVEDSMYEYGKEVVAKADELLAEIPNKSTTAVIEGSALHIIIQEAKTHNSDLIIMGSRGLSGIKEMLGSVSHYITQHSSVPVLLMK